MHWASFVLMDDVLNMIITFLHVCIRDGTILKQPKRLCHRMGFQIMGHFHVEAQ